jgi:hypothetical protein
MTPDEYQAEQSIEAMREIWDRQFAQAKGEERIIELLRLALDVERVMHDLTRRSMERTQNTSESKTAIIRSLCAILDRHGIEHPPLPEEMTVVTH